MAVSACFHDMQFEGLHFQFDHPPLSRGGAIQLDLDGISPFGFTQLGDTLAYLNVLRFLRF